MSSAERATSPRGRANGFLTFPASWAGTRPRSPITTTGGNDA